MNFRIETDEYRANAMAFLILSAGIGIILLLACWVDDLVG